MGRYQAKVLELIDTASVTGATVTPKLGAAGDILLGLWIDATVGTSTELGIFVTLDGPEGTGDWTAMTSDITSIPEGGIIGVPGGGSGATGLDITGGVNRFYYLGDGTEDSQAQWVTSEGGILLPSAAGLTLLPVGGVTGAVIINGVYLTPFG